MYATNNLHSTEYTTGYLPDLPRLLEPTRHVQADMSSQGPISGRSGIFDQPSYCNATLRLHRRIARGNQSDQFKPVYKAYLPTTNKLTTHLGTYTLLIARRAHRIPHVRLWNNCARRQPSITHHHRHRCHHHHHHQQQFAPISNHEPLFFPPGLLTSGVCESKPVGPVMCVICHVGKSNPGTLRHNLVPYMYMRRIIPPGRRGAAGRLCKQTPEAESRKQAPWAICNPPGRPGRPMDQPSRVTTRASI